MRTRFSNKTCSALHQPKFKSWPATTYLTQKHMPLKRLSTMSDKAHNSSHKLCNKSMREMISKTSWSKPRPFSSYIYPNGWPKIVKIFQNTAKTWYFKKLLKYPSYSQIVIKNKWFITPNSSMFALNSVKMAKLSIHCININRNSTTSWWLWIVSFKLKIVV